MLSNSQQRFNQIMHLQGHPKFIRNISIIAHVDHGKTTFSDQLISSNNIISRKLAGQLRYLDSRPDEQKRGITMKSSSISIIYDSPDQKHYLINLIDSPGHVEFSSEVSAALRLTDGALVLIDVIEGFSSQTYTVLKQMYNEGIRGILVLNKIDRLITELQMAPSEAFIHLSQIIDQVNATLSSFLREKMNIAQDQNNEDLSEQVQQLDEENIMDEEESRLYFAPEKDNIVFCSAIDSWGFTISAFANIHAKKLGCNPKQLQKYLWGNYYLDPKKKQVRSKPLNDNQKPMFVEFIANNLWKIYEASENKETALLSKMSAALGIENSTTAQQLLSRWLPLDKTVLSSVVNLLPSPQEAQKDRLQILSKKMMKFISKYEAQPTEAEAGLYQKYRELARSITECDVNGPLVLFISKMISVPSECVNEKGLDAQVLGQRFFGFARIFSGSIQRGQKVYVIGPKSKTISQQLSDNQNDIDIKEVQINRVYLMMAQNLEGVKRMSAGNIVAIGDLDDIVFKTATISDLEVCPSFTPIHIGSISLLKTTLMPENIEDHPKLIQGLKKLNKSDPSIEVFNINGDLVLGTCGQVHLQRCITDLEEKMALCKIKVSEPIISFKETIVYNNLFEESLKKIQNKKAKALQQEDESKKQNKQRQKPQKDTSNDVEKERKQKIKEEYLKDKETEVVNTNEIEENGTSIH